MWVHTEKSFRNQMVFTIFQIDLKMINTIWFRVDSKRFRKDFSVYRRQEYVQCATLSRLVRQILGRSVKPEIRLYLLFSDRFGTANGRLFAVFQSEYGKYNLISVLFNKIPKRFLVANESDLPVAAWVVFSHLLFLFGCCCYYRAYIGTININISFRDYQGLYILEKYIFIIDLIMITKFTSKMKKLLNFHFCMKHV